MRPQKLVLLIETKGKDEPKLEFFLEFSNEWRLGGRQSAFAAKPFEDMIDRIRINDIEVSQWMKSTVPSMDAWRKAARHASDSWIDRNNRRARLNFLLSAGSRVVNSINSQIQPRE